MTLSADDLPVESQSPDWTGEFDKLMDELANWASEAGWQVQHEHVRFPSHARGQFEVRALTVTFPGGHVTVRPKAILSRSGEARVDVEAYPTLHRVRLIGHGDRWEILTDSNVPLRQPWSADTFARLVRDLTA